LYGLLNWNLGPPLRKLKLVELRQIAKRIRIKSSGNKKPLLSRIETYFSNQSWLSNYSKIELLSAIDSRRIFVERRRGGKFHSRVGHPFPPKQVTKNSPITELIYRVWIEKMLKFNGLLQSSRITSDLFLTRISYQETMEFPKQQQLIDKFLTEFCDDEIPRGFSFLQSITPVNCNIFIWSEIPVPELTKIYQEQVTSQYHYFQEFRIKTSNSAKIGNIWFNHLLPPFGSSKQYRNFNGKDYPLLFCNKFYASWHHPTTDKREGRLFRAAFRIYFMAKNENKSLKIHLLKTMKHYPDFEKILFECEKHGKFVLNGSNITLIERDTICQECYEGLGSGFKMTGDAIFYVFKHHNSKLFNGGISNLQSYEVRKNTHQRESGDFEIIEELTGHSSSIFGLELALKKDLLEDIKNVERYKINPLDYARKMGWVQEQTIVIEPLLNK